MSKPAPQSDLVRMRFYNPDATPASITIDVRKASCTLIAQLYGAFHAGDKYTLHIDGKKQKLNQNGEILPAA